MISRIRWNQIEAGDYIWLGRHWRKVIESSKHCGKSACITFDKVNRINIGGSSTTVYLFNDIKRKIKGICKPKI